MTTGSVARIEELCGRRTGERALRIALVEELRRSVGFDWYAWLVTDPETEVGTSPLADAPSLTDVSRLIRYKYLTTVNRWTTLDAEAVTLAGATDGDLGRSLLWREVLSTYGVSDVASVVFRDAHGCWGWLDLWRSSDATAFGPADVAYLSAIGAPITEALRRAQAQTFDDATTLPVRSGPVLLVLSHQLDVRAQTPDTEDYLRALMPPDGDRRPIPAAAYHVAAQLLAVEAGTDDHAPSALVHLDGRGWLTLRAARVEHDGDAAEREIAVTIEQSSPVERRELFARSHALSARETELVDLLAQGADTRTIANELFLSAHTVQDHLKSIFAKTGTRNRRTLLTRLTGC
jgi:DNA-binding CsgD family transcriptional regulator